MVSPCFSTDPPSRTSPKCPGDGVDRDRLRRYHGPSMRPDGTDLSCGIQMVIHWILGVYWGYIRGILEVFYQTKLLQENQINLDMGIRRWWEFDIYIYIYLYTYVYVYIYIILPIHGRPRTAYMTANGKSSQEWIRIRIRELQSFSYPGIKLSYTWNEELIPGRGLQVKHGKLGSVCKNQGKGRSTCITLHPSPHGHQDDLATQLPSTVHLWRTYEEHSCSHFDVYPDIANFTFAIVFHPKVKHLVNTWRQIATWYLVRWKCLHFRKVQRGSSRLEFRVHLVAILPGSAPSCSRQVSWFSWIKWWL